MIIKKFLQTFAKAIQLHDKENLQIQEYFSLLDITGYFLKYLGFILQTINNPESSRCAVSYTYINGDKSRTIFDAPGSENANNILNLHYRNYNKIDGIDNFNNKPVNSLKNIILFNNKGDNTKEKEHLIWEDVSQKLDKTQDKKILRTHSSLMNNNLDDKEEDGKNKKIIEDGFNKNLSKMIDVYIYITCYLFKNDKLKSNMRNKYYPTKNVLLSSKDFDSINVVPNILIPGLQAYSKLFGDDINKFFQRPEYNKYKNILNNSEDEVNKFDNDVRIIMNLNLVNDIKKINSEYMTLKTKNSTTISKINNNNKLYYEYMKLVIRQSLYILPLISEMKRETYKQFRKNKYEEYQKYNKFFKHFNSTAIISLEDNNKNINLVADGGIQKLQEDDKQLAYKYVDVPSVLNITEETYDPKLKDSNTIFLESVSEDDTLKIEKNHKIFFPFKEDNAVYEPIVILPTHRESKPAVNNTIRGTIMLLDQILGKTTQESEVKGLIGGCYDSKNKNIIKRKSIKTKKKYKKNKNIKNKTGKKRKKKSDKIKEIKKSKNKLKITKAIVKHL